MDIHSLPQLALIKERKPLIQSITNPVTVNDCANILLAVGASPIMAHHIKEVAQVQSNADGLLVNLGATDDYDSIYEAVVTANSCKHPVVLDPVGVTISDYRRDFAINLIKRAHIDLIRCNYGEALKIAGVDITAEGLDSKISVDSKESKDKFIHIISEFSKVNNLKFVVSGPVDFVIDGDTVCEISTGHPMMKLVTGMGCMYSEIVCAFLAVDSSYESAKNAVYFYGECGRIVGNEINGGGTMTFRNNFIDAIYKVAFNSQM